MNVAARFLSELRFPGSLKQSFLDDYYEKSLKPLRFALLFGAVLYALFGLLDARLIPEVKTRAWLIRFGVICPASLAVLLATYTPRFRKYMQPTLALLMLLSGGGLIAIMVIARQAGNYFYYSGLILVIMYAYTFVKLRFFYATAAAWLVMSLYEAATLLMGPPSVRQFLSDNFLFMSANLIGMFSCYHVELSSRRDFLRNRAVRELEETRHLMEREDLREAIERATKSLQESEAKFRTLAQTTTAAIFMHRGGRFIYANPAGVAPS